jgi:hypothetical protein
MAVFAKAQAAQNDLDQCASTPARHGSRPMWQDISGAPFDRDLELSVIDRDGPHALVFACRRVLNGWIDAETGKHIQVYPTHWRPWRHAS